MTDQNSAAVVEPLDEADAPAPEAKHHILFTFPTDHELNGMKAEIMNVTPEQCAVAAYHLLRSANQLSDAIMLHAARERGEIDAVMRELRAGGKGH
jgi:hypothetical protein